MSRLTDEELLQIQTFIDRGRHELERLGLSIEIDSDLYKWVKLLRRAPGATGLASTHDPRRSYVHPGNAFWVIVRENSRRWWERPLRRKGPIIACLCHKVVETEDILEEIRTHRLFFDKKPSLDYQPVDIVASDNMPTIGGHVGFAGGFWVHPKHRGTIVTGIVSRLTRVLSLRHFDIDWAISLVKDSGRRKLMIQNTYGIPNSVSVLRGYYPPYARDYDMQMSYMHRDEMMRQVIEENLAVPPATEDRPVPREEPAPRQQTQHPVAVGGSVH